MFVRSTPSKIDHFSQSELIMKLLKFNVKNVPVKMLVRSRANV
jgi:hypothetical protein